MSKSNDISNQAKQEKSQQQSASQSKKTNKQTIGERIKGIFLPSLPKEAMQSPKLSFKTRYSTLILASLSINLLALALPIMTLQVYDRILISESLGTLRVLAVGVCIVIILEGILRLARSYVIHWASAVYEHTILCNSMRHMLASDLSVLEKLGVSEQLQRMTSVNKLNDFMSGQALITLIDLPFVFIFLALIWYLAGPLVLVPVILLVIFGFIAWHLGRKLKQRLAKRTETDKTRIGSMIEALSGIHTIKSLGLENIFQRRYEQMQADTSISHYHVAKESHSASNYSSLFTQAMMVCIAGFGAPMVMQGELTLGILIACILLSGRIMSPVQRGLAIWTRFQDSQLAKEAVTKTFELPILVRNSIDQLGAKEGALNIENLCFSYGPKEPELFDNLSLKLKRGQSIAISGDHSSGKTTLLKLIAGLYLPTKGDILINGVSATKYPARELVQHVGYMAMEGMIFRGTIHDNLTSFGEISDAKMHEVLQLLEMEQEIAKLPAGFETRLEGRDADQIPPGLKQRITIARALGSKPRILLFDNADRGLDKEGYNQVYRLLGRLKGKATMIIVSDDRNIQRLAEAQYVLANGKLIERSNADHFSMHDVLPYQELRL